MVFAVTFDLFCLSLPNMTFFLCFCLSELPWFFLFLLELFLDNCWVSSKLSNSGDESSARSVTEVLCVGVFSVCIEMDVSAGKVCVCSFVDVIWFVCVACVLSKLLVCLSAY